MEAIEGEVKDGVDNNDTKEGREEPTMIRIGSRPRNVKRMNVGDTKPTTKYDQLTPPTPESSAYEELNKVFTPVVFKTLTASPTRVKENGNQTSKKDNCEPSENNKGGHITIYKVPETQGSPPPTVQVEVVSRVPGQTTTSFSTPGSPSSCSPSWPSPRASPALPRLR